MIVRAIAAAAAMAVGTTVAIAADPADYGGGKCHEMAQRHDPATLWVGRFSGEKDPGPGDQVSAVACFTERAQCMRWVDRDSGGGFSHIYQMSCHKGV